jgi:hypothetical protein
MDGVLYNVDLIAGAPRIACANIAHRVDQVRQPLPARWLARLRSLNRPLCDRVLPALRQWTLLASSSLTIE